MPEILEDEIFDDDDDLSNKATRFTKRAKVNTMDAIGPEITIPTQEEETSQPPVSKQKLRQRKYGKVETDAR